MNRPRRSAKARSGTRARSRAAQSAAAGGILLLAAGLLLIWPGTLPGLHGDEAWVIFRAGAISEGLRSLDGMNYYTGALFPSAVYAAAELFGYRIEVTRTLAGLLNLGTLALIMLTLRMRHPGSRIWLWTGLLTATSVPYVLESRFATEITALAPALVFGGLCLVQYAWTHARLSRAYWAAAAGGLALGLAVYNHMATAGVVAGIGAGFVFGLRAKAFLDRRSHALAAGFLLGITPRLIQLSRVPADGPGDSPFARLGQNLTSGLIGELAQTPRIMAGMLDGDLLFQRFAGENHVAVLPFFTLALAGLIGARLAIGRPALDRGDRALLVAVGTAIVLITVMAPWLALRYYAIPVLAGPYLIVRLASSCMSGARWPRAIGAIALVLVPAAQLYYVSVNYFYAHRASGGKVSVFPLGTRLKETSNHFIRTDTLYPQLIEKGIETIYADFLLGLPLAYYDRDTERLRFIAHSGAQWLPEHGVSARVFYNGPTPMAGTRVIDARDASVIDLYGPRFVVDESFDPHFRVFVYRPE